MDMLLGEVLAANARYTSKAFEKVAETEEDRQKLADKLNEIRDFISKRAMSKSGSVSIYGRKIPENVSIYGRKIPEQVLETIDRSSNTVDNIVDTGKKVVSVGADVADTVIDLKNGGEKTQQGIKNVSQEVKNQVQGIIKDTVDSSFNTAKDAVSDNVRSINDSIKSYTIDPIKNHPFIAGGIALGAVGVGVGSYILSKKRDKRERELLGKEAHELNHVDGNTQGLLHRLNGGVQPKSLAQAFSGGVDIENEETKYDIKPIKLDNNIARMHTVLPNN